MAIRFAGQCARVAAKIVDNNNGSYDVVYVPRVTGVCTISVSLLGEALGGLRLSCAGMVAGGAAASACSSFSARGGRAFGYLWAERA